MTFNLCSIIFIVAAITIVVMGLYWYSEENKRWFHLFIRMVWEYKCMLFLLLVCTCIMFFCKVDRLKIVIDFPEGYDEAITDILFAIASGYVSGYIVFLLSVLVPNAKKQRAIFSIYKQRLYFITAEIETMICREDTRNKDYVLGFIKNGAKWNDCMGTYTISTKGVKYILTFCGKVSDTLNSIMEHTEYIEMQDLDLINTVMYDTEKLTEKLKDHDDNNAYYDESQMEYLACTISSIYKNIVKLTKKLQDLV